MAADIPRISRSQVAAGDAGIEEVVSQLSAHELAFTSNLQKNSSGCKTTAYVLALLAVIAAAASTSLIIYSGGLTNLQLFIPGTVFGGLSLSLIVWMTIRIWNTRKEEGAARDGYDEFLNGLSLTLEGTLDLMHKPETTIPRIKAALDGMVDPTTDNRKPFIDYVHGEYFGG